jgi:Uma2 family endonuclease
MAVQAATKRWTLDELHSLPDDGNKYEVIHGELFVTPAPTTGHEDVAARLARVLDPYVAAQRLGLVYRPRAVLRVEGSEVEPDLMVRQPANVGNDWEKAPIPILIVEILSDSTRRRDRQQKKAFYLESGVGEYWIVDAEKRSITSLRAGAEDKPCTDRMTWFPKDASKPLVFDVAEVFG